MSPDGEMVLPEQPGEVVLKDDERALLARYVSASVVPKTRKDYERELLAFTDWCQGKRRVAFPASVETVALYLATLADGNIVDEGKRPSTLRKIRSVITKAHKLREMADPCADERIRVLFDGIDREHQAGKVKRARPALASDIDAMIEVCGDSPTGLRDAAAIAIGYGAALRRSEVVALNVEDFAEEDGKPYVEIRRSKTDQTGKGAVVLIPDLAVQSVDRWLAWAGITSGAVFRKFARSEILLERRLTPQTIRLIVKERAKQAGLSLDPRKPTFSGHSLRRGAATQARLNGADVMEIQKLGRWESPAMPAIYAAVKDWTTDPNQRLGQTRKEGDQ